MGTVDTYSVGVDCNQYTVYPIAKEYARRKNTHGSEDNSNGANGLESNTASLFFFFW